MARGRITVDVIEKIKNNIYGLAVESQGNLLNCHYIDIRVEARESKYAVAERGAPKESGEDYGLSFGVKAIAGDRLKSPGYYGGLLGTSDLKKIEKVIKESIEHAHKRALANSSWKESVKERLGSVAESIYSTELAPTPAYKDTVLTEFKKDPRGFHVRKILKEALEISELISKLDGTPGFNLIYIYTAMARELFASSEGSLIDQMYPLTQGTAYVIAGDESHYDYIGDRKGWEVIEGENIYDMNFRQFALELAKETVELSKAEVLPPTEEEVTVVTDPHFNALLVHEIIGHPVEADRALKMETGYAGRSWFFKSLKKNQIGKRVASELITAYSDTSLGGYGGYKYDAEGVKSRRVVHIDKGIFKGFLNSRETAAILGEEPNGAMRAIDAVFVPLIRMTNTVFAPGDINPDEIIKEVDDGYYVCGHRIPSISESRENFSISARRVYKIRSGELVKLYRSGGITADSKDYFMSIDAVGNDFKLFPMPNCGKGTPMQAMRLGNGGPTMRGRAKLTGRKLY